MNLSTEKPRARSHFHRCSFGSIAVKADVLGLCVRVCVCVSHSPSLPPFFLPFLLLSPSFCTSPSLWKLNFCPPSCRRGRHSVTEKDAHRLETCCRRERNKMSQERRGAEWEQEVNRLCAFSSLLSSAHGFSFVYTFFSQE